MTLAPEQARPRPDLTFLRHRRRPQRSNPVIAEFIASHSPRSGGAAPRPATATTSRPAAASKPAAAARSAPPAAPRTAPPTTPRPATARPVTPPPAASPAASTSLDLGGPPSTPGGVTSLDLDAPAPAASPTSGGSSTSLDLDGPPAASPGGATSLDLDGPPPSPAGGSSSLDLGGPPSSSTSLDLGAPTPPASTPPSGSTSLDLGGPPAAAARPAPASSTSLDLGPTPTSAAPARSPDVQTSLDLDGPSAPAATPAAAPGRSAGTSLDLGGGGPSTPGRTPTRSSVPAAAAPAAGSVWVPQRADDRIPTVLQPSAPEVVLDRRQSAIGTLTIEAVVGADVGDLRLGAAYQLTSGLSSTVQHSTGRRFAPASERQRPVLLASRGPGEQLEIDLRQVRDLERVVVYAFSGNGSPVRWGGTLRISTFGGAKIEIPLDQPPSAVVTVVATIYQVDGELVIRSERDLAGRTVKEACRAYGFDRISWLDDQTPVD